MPESAKFMPRKDLLTFEEIERLVQILSQNGVDRIRITGGEPLVRAELWKLISMIRAIDGIQDIAVTTNGILLDQQAVQLKDAGLDRLNVSLDTVNPSVYEKITRRKGLEKVLSGIAAARDAGFDNIRINAVSITGISETEIIPLAAFSREHSLELRFIEFMPLDGDQAWESNQVLNGSKVREMIDQKIGSLSPAVRDNPSQPAVDFEYQDGSGKVGFINSVSEPFCQACNRMRVTAEGKFRNCLFSSDEWDVRTALRSGGSDEDIVRIVRQCVNAKKIAHGTNDGDFFRPSKAMYQIGG